MEKNKTELLCEIEMLRREIRTSREASEITSDFVVKQFEQTERMLHRFQVADAERQAVLDAATQLSIIATDLDGTIRLFSKGASTLLGYKSSEMINKKNILSLVLTEELTHYGKHLSGVAGSGLREMKVFDQFVKQKHSHAHEWVYVCKDDSLLPVSLSVTSLLNPMGGVVGYLFTAMDMTLQKQMERELIEAKESAESANASKGDFLARMSHEIRTPMNGIIGMASLLQKTALDHKQHDYIDKLLGSANTLLRLINDILDFSKIDAGKLQLEKISFNLEEILGNIVNAVGIQAEKKGLEFLFKVEPDVPYHLIGDPLRLGQILMNLTGNAVKFTSEGEIIVSVDLEKMEKNECQLRFSVRDSGPGLRKDQIDRLFSPFKQADDSITRKFGGTGLGLSICKQLAELMGGRIWAESEEGAGAEFIFTVRLPIAKGSKARKKRSVEHLKELRALVVDDNKAARDVLSAMLKSFKINVQTTTDGESALTLLEQATHQGVPYDVVLLDWMMPGIDGIETARRIKNNTAIAQVPSMLMVTANGRDEAYLDAERVGLDGFLLKPVYASVMYNTLLEIVGIGAVPGPHIVKDVYQQVDPTVLAGAHILLVDDNSINQEVAAEFLRSAKMNVTIVSNGRECLDALDKNIYDLVLMDIQMPEMDGLEASKRIRRDGRFRDLPIVAMTAHAMRGDREKSLKAGMNDHITKPIDQAELYRCLIKWMPLRRPGTSSPVPEVQASSGDHESGLPPLAGIDQVAALKTLENNKGLFVELLYDFQKRYSPLPDLMRELCEIGNWEEIEKLAHTVKGVAGYIGSSSLMKTAQALEDALKNGRLTNGKDLLLDFLEVLEYILASLNALPQVSGGIPVRIIPDGVQEKDTDKALESLRDLIEHLKKGEATAEEHFAVLHNMLTGRGLDEHLQELAVLIDDIEYDQATEAARTLLEMLEGKDES